MIFGALAWLVGGGLLRTLAIASLSALIAGGAGYVYGRIDGSQIAQIEQLRADLAFATGQIERLQQAAELAAEIDAEAAAVDAANQTLEEPLRVEIAKLPSVGVCLSAGVLRQLDRLK